MRRGGAVVGTARLVFLRSPAEFGVGHHQRIVPAAQFAQRRAQGYQPFGQLLEQVGMGAGLVVVGVETIEGQAQHGDAGTLGDDLATRFDCIAKRPRRKGGGKDMAAGKPLRRGVDVAFDLQQVLQGTTPLPAARLCHAGQVLELVGIGNGHDAGLACAERPEVATADGNAIGGVFGRRRVG